VGSGLSQIDTPPAGQDDNYLVDGKGPQSGLGTASLTLYFAVTCTIQRFILQAKAQRIADGPRQDVGDPGTHAPSR